MANNNSNTSSGGVGFVGLLTILFIALKLMGKIDWSWGWVLSPVWISALILLAVVLFLFWLEKRMKSRARHKIMRSNPTPAQDSRGYFETIRLDRNNRMLRVGFGKNNGRWFFRIDLWFFGIRIKKR
jgi:hypothetical protein